MSVNSVIHGKVVRSEIVAGVAVIRKKLAPTWVGLALILGVPCIITVQAFYFMLEVLWPLGNVLWLLGVWGVVKNRAEDVVSGAIVSHTPKRGRGWSIGYCVSYPYSDYLMGSPLSFHLRHAVATLS